MTQLTIDARELAGEVMWKADGEGDLIPLADAICNLASEVDRLDTMVRDLQVSEVDRQFVKPWRVEVHPDVAEKFIAAAIADGAKLVADVALVTLDRRVPNPDELAGTFRLALQWAYAGMGGDVDGF